MESKKKDDKRRDVSEIDYDRKLVKAWRARE
jgi:hypothetical protein